MQAVILAGGLATKLRPVTEKMPKSMILVDGKPFLVHLLGLLKNNGIYDIVLCIGYLGGQVEDYFGDGSKFGVRIRYSKEEGELLGTGGALKQAERLLNDRFLMINGDTYLPIDYRNVERFFLDSEKKSLMVVYHDKESKTRVKNNVELDEDLRVIKYEKEGSDSKLKYIDAGTSLFKRETISLIEEGRPVSLEKEVFPTLIRQREMIAYIADQRFYDIGTFDGLRAFETFLRGGEK